MKIAEVDPPEVCSREKEEITVSELTGKFKAVTSKHVKSVVRLETVEVQNWAAGHQV